MNSIGANGAVGPRDGESKKRTHDGTIVNGARGNSAASTPKPVSAVPTPVSDKVAQLPPELAHVAASSYHPYSKLLQRINQECFNDLNEVLQRMADIPTTPQTNGALPNGLGAHGGENSEASKQKRSMLLRFAQDNRAKYIKMLVLADWGKKSAADIAKLIDLFAWSREQTFEQDSADAQLEMLKMMSAQARQSNPDIRTALEILTTQKADWLPDLGYVPPEPISSEKALKLLQYMNTSLTIRLIVHEELPRYLENWRVESGRAIFRVDNEFEFDVMAFTEDTSDQWHFIDFRLLFSPAPKIDVDSRVLFELKNIMDVNLATDGKGLEECFNFLHNFTLTHKISVLRSQAYALLRTGWDGSLRVDTPHRQLVLSYWIDKPGKKSWIEIGISSNKSSRGKVSWQGPPVPTLTARWFRQGTEVKDVDLKLDWNNLSAERILKRVITLHIGHLLQTTRQNMKLNTTVKATFAETEPADCKLEASMGSFTNTVTLSVEPATGRYILQPVTSLSAGAEHAINRAQDAAQPGNIVTQLLSRSLLDLVQRGAQQLGWKQVGRQTLRLDAVKAAVKREVLQFVLYCPRGWSARWALGAIVDPSGESWWICKMGTTGQSIEHAQNIAVERSHGPLDLTRQTLAAIARVAVNTISIHVNSQALREQGKSSTVDDDFAQPKPNSTSQRTVRGWVLHVKTEELLSSKPGEESWLQPSMRLVCHGQQLQSQKVWHIATGSMVPSIADDMKKLMASSPQSDFNFSDNGHFQILLNTAFGEEAISKLTTRLRDVNRLRSFATTLQRRKLALQSSSLTQVRFRYSNSLLATVKFGEGDNVKLELDERNPHMRIRKFLEEIVNDTNSPSEDAISDTTSNLDRFCLSLLYTRPLLSAIDAIEASNVKTMGSPYFHAHSIGIYRMTYTNPICAFDIKIMRKDDRVVWLIEDNARNLHDLRTKDQRTPGFRRQEDLQMALSLLYRRQGDLWYGVYSGLVAEIDGTPDALKQLHETVMKCYVEGGVKQPLANINGNQAKAAPTMKPNGQAPPPRPGTGPKRPSFSKANNTAGKPKNKNEVITIDD
ncbi:MED14-domain-containing protein [Byssothecium circinans]|uniref:Mediator of RNA polymerase II transcription subunit 14 n=1 Tax=Byssothecium circinans TaxID=147558 RepID=A0A6A5TX52_9PLEO|nr:MED14-domain-containing protein [Byssothecium circinans]